MFIENVVTEQNNYQRENTQQGLALYIYKRNNEIRGWILSKHTK